MPASVELCCAVIVAWHPANACCDDPQQRSLRKLYYAVLCRAVLCCAVFCCAAERAEQYHILPDKFTRCFLYHLALIKLLVDSHCMPLSSAPMVFFLRFKRKLVDQQQPNSDWNILPHCALAAACYVPPYVALCCATVCCAVPCTLTGRSLTCFFYNLFDL